MGTKTGFIMGLTVFLLMIFVTGGLFAENKRALVIGNSSYQHFPSLSQPRREAQAMKSALERLGRSPSSEIKDAGEPELLLQTFFRVAVG